jgi:Fe-S-cluster containining protein
MVYRRASLKPGMLAKTIEFLYPANLGWDCARCGACCRDAGERERRILLLETDVSRLKGQLGGGEFAEPIRGREPFVAEMRKIGGRCFFLSDDGCSAYDRRALLCRMYPFWVERSGGLFIIRVDGACPGTGGGKLLGKAFFSGLLGRAVAERGGI